MSGRLRALCACLSLLAGLAPCVRADWMQPDPSYRDAQFLLRQALRDTAGQSAIPARLDTLGVALLRLGRFAEAERVFGRALEIHPGDDAAEAGLGKLALFNDRLAAAESLLAGGLEGEGTAAYDLLAARIRRGEYASAAALADSLGRGGRAAMLRRMAEGDCYAISGAPEARVMFKRWYPVPLVRAKLNGRLVLMAVDTGAGDLIVDDMAARVGRVELLPGQTPVFWCGAPTVVRNALVQRLEIGGVKIERVPAGVLSLGRYSLEVNPQAERVAGVIGLNLLRRFTPTLDYKRQWLELHRSAADFKPDPEAQRIPFEIWGESELTVYGSLAGGRRMAMVVQTGVPECGVGAPREVFEEVGLKPGVLSRMVKGAGRLFSGRPWTEVAVPAVSVGPISKDKLDGWSGALDSSELWRHGVRRDALLAGDFFRGWRVTIDWEGRALVFEGR